MTARSKAFLVTATEGSTERTESPASSQIAPCRSCGHPEKHHVPYPTCGDLGWYGCVVCLVDGPGGARCRFFLSGAA